jgi:hypothetical protein
MKLARRVLDDVRDLVAVDLNQAVDERLIEWLGRSAQRDAWFLCHGESPKHFSSVPRSVVDCRLLVEGDLRV